MLRDAHDRLRFPFDQLTQFAGNIPRSHRDAIDGFPTTVQFTSNRQRRNVAMSTFAELKLPNRLSSLGNCALQNRIERAK